MNLESSYFLLFRIKSFALVVYHIEPRRGTLKRHKNRGKCLLNFLKLIYLIEIIYI
jgi:hypothetical protein